VNVKASFFFQQDCLLQSLLSLQSPQTCVVHSEQTRFHDLQASLISVLGGLPAADSITAKTWNVELVMEALKSYAPNLEPQRIIEALDHEGFNVPDAKGFLVLVNAWRKLTSEPFPLQASHCRA
jgi:hypothetical protein